MGNKESKNDEESNQENESFPSILYGDSNRIETRENLNFERNQENIATLENESLEFEKRIEIPSSNNISPLDNSPQSLDPHSLEESPISNPSRNIQSFPPFLIRSSPKVSPGHDFHDIRSIKAPSTLSRNINNVSSTNSEYQFNSLEDPLIKPSSTYFFSNFLPSVPIKNYFTNSPIPNYFGRLNRIAHEKMMELVKFPISTTSIDHLTLEKQLDGHLLTYMTSATVKLLYDLRTEKKIKEEGVYLDFEALQNFTLRMENLYFELPFHCKTRAAVRVHATYSKISRFPDWTFSLLDELALIIVSCMKDIRHPGLNNHFQINSMSTLARLYNFDLPLENYSCYLAFQTMKEDSTCDFMKLMSNKAARHLRERIIYICTEGSRSDLFVYTAELRALMEGQSRTQILNLPITNPNIFFPFLIHMSEQVHYWGLQQGGHNYWHTQEMRELMHQSDLEEKLYLPRTVPSRESMKNSFDDYSFFVHQRFAYVDDAMYLLHNLLSMVKAHHIMQQNILWWSSQVNYNSPIFRVMFEKPIYNPEFFQRLLEDELNSRVFPMVELNVKETIQQEYARKVINLQGNSHFVGELLEYICGSMDNRGNIQIPEKINLIPYFVKDLSTSIELTKQLSNEERKSAILYHMLKYRDIDFDIFSLTALLGDSPLVFVTKTIIQSRDLINTFKIPEMKLINFLHKVQSSYHQNPYHNAIHGGCIVQASEYILRKSLDSYPISKEYYIAIFLAAAAHDADHPGMSNSYQRNSSSYLTLLYNDRSIIENHSASRCIELLLDPECSIFENIDKDTQSIIFRIIITSILATDMERHALFLNRFKDFIPDYTDDNDIMFVASMVVKLSDLVNAFRPTRIYTQWSARICMEFLQQGDYERFHGYEIGPSNDRERLSIERCQHFFLDKVVKPFLEVFHAHYPRTYTLLRNLNENIEYWEKKIELEIPKHPTSTTQNQNLTKIVDT